MYGSYSGKGGKDAIEGGTSTQEREGYNRKGHKGKHRRSPYGNDEAM